MTKEQWLVVMGKLDEETKREAHSVAIITHSGKEWWNVAYHWHSNGLVTLTKDGQQPIWIGIESIESVRLYQER